VAPIAPATGVLLPIWTVRLAFKHLGKDDLQPCEANSLAALITRSLLSSFLDSLVFAAEVHARRLERTRCESR
jgi:hypothetical protein